MQVHVTFQNRPHKYSFLTRVLYLPFQPQLSTFRIWVPVNSRSGKHSRNNTSSHTGLIPALHNLHGNNTSTHNPYQQGQAQVKADRSKQGNRTSVVPATVSGQYHWYGYRNKQQSTDNTQQADQIPDRQGKTQHRTTKPA